MRLLPAAGLVSGHPAAVLDTISGWIDIAHPVAASGEAGTAQRPR